MGFDRELEMGDYKAEGAKPAANKGEVDDWLPVGSQRSGKWWYSTFHNVTAMVGAGILSLPYAMSEMGWGPGVAMMILSWAITLYTLYQMVEMHECVPGKRFDRYHELGQAAFGPKLGLWIVVPQQALVEISLCIIYMVTGGSSIKKVVELLCHDCKPIKLSYYILIFSVGQFIASFLPNFNSISFVSLLAAIMSVSYSTIAWGSALHKWIESHAVDYGPRSHKKTDNVFMFMSALGDMAFSYAGHNVVLEIQATIPSTPDNPSKKAMWKGVVIAYVVVAMCYWPVAFIGYLALGNQVSDNILLTLEKPVWLIAAANIFVVVHVVGSYQVYAMLMFDMIETFCVKTLKFKPTKTLRFVTRNLFVAFTLFVGISVPFFGGLLGFFGGFAFAPTTYYIPCIMWLILMKPKKFGLSWCMNWTFIVIGILLTILAPIGGLWSIVKSAKTYHFYQ
ncbi:PREDICTED: lysine histidine transporter 2-like [Ipomoea nil]|uniref:lysine histidine transporter 2-like n=1 Tax=Ipomoea nil TaxID=35883 RepID=UPI000901C8BE|nr:PREDICTED: lysine histidine transporter 2-like [Ipomoea nil]